MFIFSLNRQTIAFHAPCLLILPFLLSVHQAIMPTFHSEWLMLVIFSMIALSQALGLEGADAIRQHKPWREDYIFSMGFFIFLVYIFLQSFFLKDIYSSTDHQLPAVIIDGQVTAALFIAFGFIAHELAQYYRLEHLRHRQLGFFYSILHMLIILGFIQSLILGLQFIGCERDVLKLILYIPHGLGFILDKCGLYTSAQALLSMNLDDVRLISIASKMDETFRPFANLNQPNHTSSIMAWSVLAYLIKHFLVHTFEYKPLKHIRSIKYWLGATVLISAWVLPASRTAVFQIVMLALLFFSVAFIFAMRLWFDKKLSRRLYYRDIAYIDDHQQRLYIKKLLDLLKLGAIYILIFFIAALLLDVASQLLQNKVSTLWQRLFTPYENQNYAQLDMRGLLHQQGWAMFKNQPWWGVGANGFPWQQYLLIDHYSFSEFANSSHQVFIDTLAKFGIFGFMIILFIFVAYVCHQLYIIYHLFIQLRSESIHFREECFMQLEFKRLRGELYDEDPIFNAHLKRISSAGYVRQKKHTFRYLIQGVFSLGILSLFFIHTLVEYPQNYLFFWLFLIFILSSLQLSSKQIDGDEFHRDWEDDYIAGRFETIEEAKASQQIIYSAAPTLLKKLNISDEQYTHFKSSISYFLTAAALLTTALYAWNDFQAIKNQQNPKWFFHGYAAYQKAANVAYFAPIKYIFKNQTLNEKDEELCKKAQNITTQGLYLFISHEILKRDIYLSICQNQNEKALNAYQRMNLYFYAPKTWQQDILNDMQSFKDPRFKKFAEKIKHIK